MSARDIHALVLLPGSPLARKTVLVTQHGSLLAGLQAVIGGWIEAVPVTEHATMYIDEEGKLKGLPLNAAADALVAVAGTRLQPGDHIVGPAVVVGAPDAAGYDTDLPAVVLALADALGLTVLDEPAEPDGGPDIGCPHCGDPRGH